MDVGAPQQWNWLVQTKLQSPLPCSDVIPRPRLLVGLRDAVTTHRLTLLSAPAGYGKTTLLTTLPSTCPGLPLTWLTLDEGDNDPALFLAYLIAALRRLDPACGTTAQTLLSELPNPAGQVQRLVGVLINDILETLPTPFALVLDDVHLVVEPAVHAALDYLLEHLPPQMHLVVSTRQDPPLALARLRGRGQLAEVRVTDLRFTLEEAATFLNTQLHLGLSPDDLTALQARAEGWAAGLRLLASSLDRIPTATDRHDFITHLARTDRYVFDFLAEEVLRRQDETMRTFLLQTSILSELTPQLCQAVTGRGDAPATLEELDRRSLFVVAMDQGRRTFRYHALFAEFLRQRLAREMPGQVAALHRQAAEAQPTAERAIGHYLAGEMWPEAAQAIERVGGELLYEGLVDTLVGWIHALPDPVREVHPRLSYLLGMCTWQMGNIDTAQSLQEQALQGFEATGDEAGQGEVLTEMAGYAIMQADFGRMGETIHRALAYPIPPLSRVQLLMGRTWLGIFSGELIQAAADWEATLVVLQETAGSDVLRVLLGYLNPLLAALPGGVERIERVLRQAVPHFGDQISPARVFIERNMAFVHFWRGRPAQAIQAGESALAVSERLGGTPPLDAASAAVVAVAHAVQGDDAAADHFFDLLFHQIEWLAVERLFEVGFLYLLGRARSLQGRQEEARQVYERMETLSGPSELSFASVLRLRMQALLGMANRRYAEAERVLRQAVKMEPEATFSILFGSARLMLARLYVEQDRLQEALAEVAPLLAECKRQDTPGRILQEGAIAVPVLRLAAARGVHASFAARLLTLLDVERKPQPVYVQETGETLTRREVEVLRLMATGASNRIIAEQLVISEHTVKSHVSHILRKLDVSSRVQAVAHARELGIGV